MSDNGGSAPKVVRAWGEFSFIFSVSDHVGGPYFIMKKFKSVLYSRYGVVVIDMKLTK